MTSHFRISSAISLVLFASPAVAAEYHGPLPQNFDDATYFYDDAAPSAGSLSTAQATAMDGKGSDVMPAVATPQEGTDIRTSYDAASPQSESAPAQSADAPADSTDQ